MRGTKASRRAKGSWFEEERGRKQITGHIKVGFYIANESANEEVFEERAKSR